MTFEEALTHLRKIGSVRRDKWTNGSAIQMVHGVIYFQTPGGTVMPWVPSREDIEASDWRFA